MISSQLIPRRAAVHLTVPWRHGMGNWVSPGDFLTAKISNYFGKVGWNRLGFMVEIQGEVDPFPNYDLVYKPI